MTTMKPIRRRSFLKKATVFAAGAALPKWWVEQSACAADPIAAKSPNDQPAVALIGCGGRGRVVAGDASKFGRIIAVCDLDERHAAQAAKQFEGAKPYKDFRKLLDTEKVDVVVNGTPDHWHTLINLAALKRGKDIYSEKPLTLTIDEGQRLVKAVTKSKRILQTGSQQRSDDKFRLACELVRNGRIGKLKHVHVWVPAGLHAGPFSPAPVPTNLDWDTWQGQTPSREYVPQRCHVTFRFFLEYSAGTLTDWGAHHNDIALWGLGLERSGPATIEGRRLIDPVPGGFTTPSQYKIQYTYANGVTHTCETTTRNRFDGSINPDETNVTQGQGVKFEGEDGWISVTRGKIEASRPELLQEPLTNKKVELYVSKNHMQNFFDCVRSRRQPICEAEIGHRSVSVCHLGLIAIQLGRKLEWDPKRERFVNDKDAAKFIAREMRKPWDYSLT
jgi:predicted dehydrogenase